MKTKVLDRQNILDIALQESGKFEGAFDVALQNDVSVSAEGEQISDKEGIANQLDAPQVIDEKVVSRYAFKKIRPATDMSHEDIVRDEMFYYGGIGYMAIDINFIIS